MGQPSFSGEHNAFKAWMKRRENRARLVKAHMDAGETMDAAYEKARREMMFSEAIRQSREETKK